MLETETTSTGAPAEHNVPGGNLSIMEWAAAQDGFPFAFAAQELVRLGHPLTPQETRDIVFDPRLQALQYAYQGYGEGPDAFEQRLEAIDDPEWNPSVANRLRLGFYSNRAERQKTMAELTEQREVNTPHAKLVFSEAAARYKAEAKAAKKIVRKLKKAGYTLPQEMEVRHLAQRVVESHLAIPQPSE